MRLRSGWRPAIDGRQPRRTCIKARLLAPVLVLLSGIAQSHDPVAGDPERGRQKAQSEDCIACHGPEGHRINPERPKLAGLDASYLYTQLVHFKHGSRQHPFMTPQVQGLSDQDMQDLAAYFAGQTMQEGGIDPRWIDEDALEDLREEGARIYRNGLPEQGMVACMACHGPHGLGLPMAGIPRIAGQNFPYLTAQLHAYRAGDRTTDPKGVMRDVASELSDDMIRALSAYAATMDTE